MLFTFVRNNQITDDEMKQIQYNLEKQSFQGRIKSCMSKQSIVELNFIQNTFKLQFYNISDAYNLDYNIEWSNIKSEIETNQNKHKDISIMDYTSKKMSVMVNISLYHNSQNSDSFIAKNQNSGSNRLSNPIEHISLNQYKFIAKYGKQRRRESRKSIINLNRSYHEQGKNSKSQCKKNIINVDKVSIKNTISEQFNYIQKNYLSNSNEQDELFNIDDIYKSKSKVKVNKISIKELNRNEIISQNIDPGKSKANDIEINIEKEFSNDKNSNIADDISSVFIYSNIDINDIDNNNLSNLIIKSDHIKSLNEENKSIDLDISAHLDEIKIITPLTPKIIIPLITKTPNITHICTTIINLDDEQCILNMNKNLFRKKLNININVCQNQKELYSVLLEMSTCISCRNCLILIICDQMLDHDQGSDVIRRVKKTEEFKDLNLKFFGLTSSEDIQVRDDFEDAGIQKLFIKPLKISQIKEIVNELIIK